MAEANAVRAAGGGDDSGFGAGGFTSGATDGESVGLSWFRLVFSFVYLLCGVAALAKFFLVRNVLEIRARSAYLVLVLGVCLLMYFAINVHLECINLFGWPSHIFSLHLIYFFTIFTIACCYITRVIRLGVAFCPRIKRAIPWIMSERLLVTVSLTLGAFSMAIPGYYYHNTHGSDDLVNFVLKERDVVWICQCVLIGIQLALLPVVWMVDDIFRISWELAVIVMLGLVDVVTVRLAETSVLTPGLKEYINSANIGVIWTAVLFGLSVVDPIRRLHYNPIAKMSTSMTRGVHPRPRNRSTNNRKVSASSEMTENYRSPRFARSDDRSDSFGSNTEPSSMRSSVPRRMWSYDRMAAVPAVAEAFRAFAWRALCQESVMFLEEVSKYESGNYTIASPIQSQFAAFNLITKRFIADGSQDEINISSRDKLKLMGIYNAGAAVFFGFDDDERRLVFEDAYLEIRSMLEVNLMHRFVGTDGFKKVHVSPAQPGEDDEDEEDDYEEEVEGMVDTVGPA